uniref:G_PROTEIN_RECEP_F1_2 domain-containing protein n=1 Tax=Steinernema glaseri TaxID=37863 RepID=A0A1I7ZZQ1_9BILA
MTNAHEALYNQLLDYTAVIHCSTKIAAVLLILFATPQKMRPLSLYLLNGMLWNFAANIVLAFVHIYPLFPVLCFRIDGLASSANTTITGQALFVALIVCVLNCTSAHAAIFFYRYMIFAHTATLVKWRYRCRFILAIWHTATAGITVVVYGACMTATAERNLRICFKTDGWQHPTAVMALLLSFAFAIAVGTISTVLLLYSFHKKKAVMSPQLLNSHKGILRVLLAVTTVPAFFGAVPVTVIVIYTLQPQLPFAKEIVLVFLVIIANYGSIYAVVVIVAIKPYREAACSSLLGMLCCKRTHHG